MHTSPVVEQSWHAAPDGVWSLHQTGSRAVDLRPLPDGGWIAPTPTTTPGLRGHRYNDLAAASAAESARAAAQVLDALSDDARAVLRTAGLLP